MTFENNESYKHLIFVLEDYANILEQLRRYAQDKEDTLKELNGKMHLSQDLLEEIKSHTKLINKENRNEQI